VPSTIALLGSGKPFLFPDAWIYHPFNATHNALHSASVLFVSPFPPKAKPVAPFLHPSSALVLSA
jgi:hypothetical protein